MLSPQQQELLKRAKQAKPDYAVALLIDLVKQSPDHIEARRLLRANELTLYQKASSMSKTMSGMKITPMQMKGKGALKKDPKEAMAIAEDILAIDPTSEAGNDLLADAAIKAELPEVAVLALETLKDAKPELASNLKKLGALYLEQGNADKAVGVFDIGLKHHPTDGELNKGLKDASALAAQTKGGWDEGSSFRDSLKDTEEATRLEQGNRVVKSVEAIDQQLVVLYEQYNENNQNLDTVKRIADLLEKRESLDDALAYYQYAYELGGQSDPVIEKKITELSKAHLSQALDAKEQELAQADDSNRASLEAEYQQLKSQFAEYELSSARSRVEKYPNDKALRFELGKCLVDAGHFREAIPELQQATNAPNVRLQAMNYLGLCQQNLQMFDLAINQFKKAISEMVVMDELKKETIYNLGITLEMQGDSAQALDQFKAIYEVDYHFKDVAQRVESAY
ncbi:MAG: hypothetical protein AAFY98_09830 [Verrucomicrobiota bacterium]